jgi:hypothetical protein
MQLSLVTLLAICTYVTALPGTTDINGACDQAACERSV